MWSKMISDDPGFSEALSYIKDILNLNIIPEIPIFCYSSSSSKTLFVLKKASQFFIESSVLILV